MPLDLESARALARAALREDLGEKGDVTSEAVIPAGMRARGRILSRQALVVAGTEIAREVFLALDPSLGWSALPEGTEAKAGEILARVEGAARPILAGERTALNFLQRLCGIASMAREAVREVSGTGAIVLDTRKTTPTLRALEKHAVAAGGASNHRFGLYDAVLIKDNHIRLAGGIAEAVARAREAGLQGPQIEVEVEDLEGLRQALEAGAGRILLDNFTPEKAAEGVRIAKGRAAVECSGNLRPGFLRPYAEAGADFLSLGCLTHSAPASDLTMEIERVGEAETTARGR